MAGGYMGQMLFVDLSKERLEVRPLDEGMVRLYVGGYGVGARMLLEWMRPGVDALGPENVLGFVTGPLTGTPALVGSRYTVVGKSPLTLGWGDANSGGYFGSALKQAGYDAVFFCGRAKEPVWLLIDNGEACLRDASDLWGRDVNATEEALLREVGSKARVACIGRAGERLSLLSCIINDRGRAAGRSGLGAVMGSKNLKAIAVLGQKKVPLADEKRAYELRKTYLAQMRGWVADDAKQYGTCGGVEAAARSGDGPIKNWGGTPKDVPTVDRISDDNVIKYQRRRFACWQCVTGCGGIGEVGEGPYRVREGHKPEYETLASFGFLCLNDNVESIWKANEMCNEAGLDTISAGAAIAFAIECYENGLLSREETDGIELTWGNHVAIVQMLEKMVRREGLGALLADGVMRAAKAIGRGAERYAVHVGGQEPGMHDPKFAPGLALAYKVDATPGRHTQGATSLVELLVLGGTDEMVMPSLGMERAEGNQYLYATRPDVLHRFWMLNHFLNVAGLCMFHFGSMPTQSLTDFMEVVTGWEYDLLEAYRAGERAAQVRHLFNLREGINPRRVEMHPRIIGEPPLRYGPNQGITVNVDELARDFASQMSWDPESYLPSLERLQELSISDVMSLARG